MVAEGCALILCTPIEFLNIICFLMGSALRERCDHTDKSIIGNVLVGVLLVKLDIGI